MRELRQQVEQLAKLMIDSKTAATPPAPRKADYCYKCGSRDHRQKDCPKSGRVCFGCGQEGHIRRECPRNKQTGNGLPPR
jgi:hypothetical protein